MIFKKNFLFLHSLRVLHQNEDLIALLDKKKYDYITVISYRDLGLEKEGFKVKQKPIVNIYLDSDAERIFHRFARTTRNEISKTYKIPELRFEIGDNNLTGAYNLYRQFEQAQGRRPWKIDTFQGTKLFNAYYRGELVVSIPCYDIFPYLQVRNISSKRLAFGPDHYFYRIIGFASRRLIYEICKYGKEKNYKFVGLGSINFSTAQKAGVSQFKAAFGGTVEDEYTYTYKSKLFKVIDRFRQLI